MAQNHLPKEYELRISTNDVKKASAEASSALYEWLDSVTFEHDDADEESDFEQFAHEVLNALGRHPAELSYEDDSDGRDENEAGLTFE